MPECDIVHKSTRSDTPRTEKYKIKMGTEKILSMLDYSANHDHKLVPVLKHTSIALQKYPAH